MWKKVWKWILTHELIVFLLAFTIFLRVPTLFEPYWYGDEGIYLAIGHTLRQGEVLYRDIHDNKPPLIYFMAALADGNQFWYRFIALWWNVATVGVFYGLSKKLFTKKVWAELVTTVLFILLTNLPMFEGNVANGELFFLLPMVWGAYLLFTAEKCTKRIFWAGCLFGIAGLFKLPALTEVGIWPIYWLVFERKTWFKRCVLLGLGLVLPVGLSFGYFGLHGIMTAYFAGAFGQNIGYVSSWGTASKGGIYTLKGRAILTALLLGIWLVLGKRFGRRAVFLAGWFILAIFGVAISGRPYPHYVLQVTGVFSLGVGVLLYGNWKERVGLGTTMLLGGLVVGLVLSGGNLRDFPTYGSTGYYRNFAAWVTKRQSRDQYFAWFDPAVPNTYQVATYLFTATTAKDRIFVWGERPMIYALAKRVPVGKYTAKYHVKDFRAESETMAKLTAEKPSYVVSYGQEEELPGLTDLLERSYKAVAIFGTARIYRYNPQL